MFAELKRVICADRALDGLGLMDALGVTDVVLPELAALRRRGAEPLSPPRRAPITPARCWPRRSGSTRTRSACAGDDQAPALHAAASSAPFANDLTRGQALRFGALLHDIAKPQTREVTDEGRVTFMGHDEPAPGWPPTILGRLRASERLREHVAALTRHHLRLGFLVHDMPLTRRDVYDYLHVTARRSPST